MTKTIDIIARKPRNVYDDSEYVVVDRGVGGYCRFVSAVADAVSLSNGEWYWGHYFAERRDALEHFNER